MADNLSVKDAAGATKTVLMNEMTVDSVLGLVQRVLLINGTADVSDSNPMPIDDAGGSLTTDTAQLPATLGQKTMAGSVGVAIASDQGAVPVSGTVAVSGTSAVGGNVAHDAADSGNPIKMGGKASSSAPADVANGDRVDMYLDTKGRVGTFAAGDVAHDAADSGNPIKIGGKASSTEPAAVSDGDRVNAWIDPNGRIAVFDGGEPLEVAGDVNAVVQGDTPHGAADAGNPINLGGRGVSSAPSNVDDGDRVRAQFDLAGRQAVFPGHGQTMPVSGTVAATNAVLTGATGRQLPAASLSTIRAKSAETAVYGTGAITGHSVEPILYSKNSDVINSAATAVTADFGYLRFGSNTDDIYYFLPVQQYRHLAISVRNSMDVSLNVSLLGYLRNGTTQEGLLLATAVTIATNNVAMFSGNAKATGASADLYAVLNLGDWDYIGIKCEAVATPSSGGVTLLVKRDE